MTTQEDNKSIKNAGIDFFKGSWTFICIKTAQAIKFKRALSQMSNIKSLKTLSVETSQRAYALETSVDLGLLEELIFESAMNADVDINNIRIVMSGTEIEVENLN